MGLKYNSILQYEQDLFYETTNNSKYLKTGEHKRSLLLFDFTVVLILGIKYKLVSWHYSKNYSHST